ncbi:unnamed protein product [Rotaria sordida]|uniref:Uncharacterized protein n=1 Tax=Rotaria sordida TaxID=392033 RepID=A0A815SXJ8_9BILA|nr:unnamed protein product [Rotaria sordida]
MGQRNLNNIRLQNVTKLQFGDCDSRSIEFCRKLTYRDKRRAKVFAHLISMCVQLKYLLVEKFEWLLYIVKYIMLNICVSVISSKVKVRPDFKSGYFHWVAQNRWTQLLQTPQSINEHVTIFEQDLSQLFEQLQQFVFLDIYGIISQEKVESYRLMIQSRFPNSNFDIQISRFRLWV